MASWYAGTCFHQISQSVRLKYSLSPILAASCYVSAPSFHFSNATSSLQTGVKTLLSSQLRNALVVIQIAFSRLSLFFPTDIQKCLNPKGSFRAKVEYIIIVGSNDDETLPELLLRHRKGLHWSAAERKHQDFLLFC